jgi:lysophospholipase L1-like esterase
MIHVSVGGSRLRARLSNEFGDGPLVIAGARIARSVARDTIDVATDRAIAFGGSASVTIPAGHSMESDPIDLVVPALSELTVSIHIRSMPAAVTGHPGSRTTSYLATGDRLAERALSGSTPTEHWYALSGLSVRADGAAVVVLGNSIADGRGSGTDKNNRWPDNLARRLQGDTRTANVAVLNAGIGGNAVLRGGLGPTALSRLERDVLAQPGARWVILSEGVNDIGGARGADSSAIVARQLIDAYGEIIRRARARGLRVYGATILPFGGSQYDRPEREAARQTVNAWIRDSGAFDAVIDFDVAMRDPSAPTRLLPSADTGDHLHPNEAGYRMMADAVDLELFRRSR